VTAINMQPDGRFPRPPEPVPENLGELEALTREAGADVGLAVDPTSTGWRSSTSGAGVGEDYTLALAAKLVLRHRRGPVVTNLSTSRVVDDVATAANAPVIRAPVGEVNVALRMRDERAAVGGEGNGGVILPELHLGRDAPLGAALVLQLLLEEGRPLSAVVDDHPRYVIVKDKLDRPTRRSTRCTRRSSRRSPTPSATRRTGSGSRGPTAGCTCGRAAPSRSCA
jgi:phosphomannomutase